MHFTPTTLALLALATATSATQPAKQMPQAPTSNIAIECTCNSNSTSTTSDSTSLYLAQNITISTPGHPYTSTPICSTPDHGGPKICITDLGDSMSVQVDGGEEKTVKKESLGMKDGVDCLKWGSKYSCPSRGTVTVWGDEPLKPFQSVPNGKNFSSSVNSRSEKRQAGAVLGVIGGVAEIASLVDGFKNEQKAFNAPNAGFEATFGSS